MKKKRNLILFLCSFIAIALACAIYLYMTLPRIVFQDAPISIEINSSYQPFSFIKDVKNGHVEDVKVIRDNVVIDKLGSYTIEYQYKDVHEKVTVEVVDRKQPVVTTKEASISIGDSLDASACIKEIKDATATTVIFKEQYLFNEVNDYPVTLIVSDEANNQTVVESIVHVLEKDETPPVITAQDITLSVNDAFDPMSIASAKDDRDGKVELRLEKNNVNTTVAGTYQVVYRAQDSHHNQAKKTITVIVQPPATGDKVIYLTIDDGPSANTPAILDILDRYHVKATFFVTAQCPEYFSYFKEASDRGHAIGLHTYSHNYAAIYQSEAAYYADLQKISDVVYEQTGIRSHIMRFPGGSSNTISANYTIGIMSQLTASIREHGYQYYDWNASSGDGNSATATADLIAGAKSYGGGSPLMMLTHDHAGSYTSVEALPSIIEYYQGLGYTFKTVDTSVSGFHHGVNN